MCDRGAGDDGGPGPMHKSCATYGTLACKFMKYPTSYGRAFKQKRGEAAIFGFRKFGVAYFDEEVGGSHLP